MGDEEWDPLAEQDDKKKENQVWNLADVSESMGLGRLGEGKQIYKQDWENAMQFVERKIHEASPWVTFPNPLPDLNWHEPTCTFESWSHKDVTVKLGQNMVVISLNRPSEENLLTADMNVALCDAVMLLHKRKDIRVVVFTGEGSFFCKGGDPKGEGYGGFTKSKQPPEVEAYRKAMGEKALKEGAFADGTINMGRLCQAKLWHTLALLPQFSVCLCNGSAMGDGMGLVCACDMAIAVKGSFFCISDVKVGLIPGVISPYIMAKTGNGIAKRMFCTAENMNTEMAQQNRVIDEIADNLQDGQKMIKDLCVELTKCPPATVEFSKKVMMGVAGQQNQEPLMHYQLAMLQAAAKSKEATATGKPWEANPIVSPM